MYLKTKQTLRGPLACACLLWLGVLDLTQAQTVSVWLTTHNLSSKLQPQASVTFSAGTGGINPVIVDETQTYQAIEGFGASFTDSAAYLLNQVATPTARSNAMNNLFTRNGSGIGVSFVRNPMGASDLTRFHYSYDDLPPGQTDTNLTSFSIAHDQADIIPLVQQALQLNPQLTIMANPWSPPGWMKTSDSMIGGTLLPQMYAPFANYFVKYIRAYAAAGIPTHYISLQNEPLYVPGDYPGMGMDAATQTTVLRDYVLPALAASNLTTKVLLFDHNWDGAYYPETVLTDPTLLASSQVAGTAWHGYGGTPGVMISLVEQFPTKGNYQTEHSSGTWVSDPLRTDFTEIIHVMRCWGKAFVKWSLALDQNRGPNVGGCNSCNPLVTVHTGSGAVSYTTDFYTLGHFSKFVLPGAVRIYSANANGVVSAAFKNPDGSKALVAFNDTTSSKTFQVEWGGKGFNYTLASYAGATFTWIGTQSSGYTVNPTNQIQGSSFNTVSGVQTEWTSDSVGGYNLGYCDNNDYAVYRDVDFGAGFTNVTTRVASFGGGTVEFRLDSPAGPLIGYVTMPNTGDWQTFQNVSGAISNASGIHDLNLVFKGGSGIANLNWFQFDGALGSGSTGVASQLIWTTQPGLATNGLPFGQQPVLQAADQYGNPSTNGLPATLDVTITQSAGTGPLLGTTNLNIGTAGWNGVVAFTDLQINSTGTDKELTASVAVTTTPSGNLLLNGNFNLPEADEPATNWTEWLGGGWTEHRIIPGSELIDLDHGTVHPDNTGFYDGTYAYKLGVFNTTGNAGIYQIVEGAPLLAYTLTCDAGAQGWWLIYGEMRLIFIDASTNEISRNVVRTTDSIHNEYNGGSGDFYDIGVVMQQWTNTAISPVGTALVKVEFVGSAVAAGGNAWFDNAVLTELGGAPWLASATTLPFIVHATETNVPPYKDPNEPLVVRLDDLMARMSLDEKVGQMCQVSKGFLSSTTDVRDYRLGSLLSGGGEGPGVNTPEAWANMIDAYQTQALSTPLQIPILYGVDAVHGHNNVYGATLFPHNIGMGATRNPDLMKRAAQVTAAEAAATGVHWTFAPTIAVARNESWGRFYESLSELPDLVGQMGAAAIQGYQGTNLSSASNIIACAKHFAGDGGTTNGTDQGNTVLDEATFRSIHIAPYEEAIAAGVKTIMVSYSSWNGAKVHGHSNLLTTVLKGELGFDGFLISDWAGVNQIDSNFSNAVVKSVNAGMDMVMVPDQYQNFLSILKGAVLAGQVSTNRINDAVRRILKVKFESGLFERPYARREFLSEVGSAAHRAVARQAVAESLVILKNDGGLLPLAKNLARIHVAGKNANDLGNQCGGWSISWQGSSGATTLGTTIFQGITNTVSAGTTVSFSLDGTGAAGADVGIVVVGETPYAEGAGDNSNLFLSASDLSAINNVRNAGVPVIVILVSGRPMFVESELPNWDASIAAWLPGTEGQGVADILFGDVTPTGRLPHSWPRDGVIPINVGDPNYEPLFPVPPLIPPISTTNYILGITDAGGGAFTLHFVGTTGADYYVQSTTDLLLPILWEPVAVSTNTVTNVNGLWSCTVTNAGLQRFYRSAVLNP